MARTRSGRRGIALVVVLVHGVAGWALQRLAPPGDRAPPARVEDRAPLVVRLVAPAPVAPGPDRTATRVTPSHRPRPAPEAAAATWIAPQEPPSADAPMTAPTPTGSAVAPPAPPADAPTQPAPLRLGLPRAASAPQRHPALDDPRAVTPPRTLESLIATATGTARPTEELRGDGRARYRSGVACVDVEPSRAGELDPFNGAVSPKPKQAKPC